MSSKLNNDLESQIVLPPKKRFKMENMESMEDVSKGLVHLESLCLLLWRNSLYFLGELIANAHQFLLFTLGGDFAFDA